MHLKENFRKRIPLEFFFFQSDNLKWSKKKIFAGKNFSEKNPENLLVFFFVVFFIFETGWKENFSQENILEDFFVWNQGTQYSEKQTYNKVLVWFFFPLCLKHDIKILMKISLENLQ